MKKRWASGFTIVELIIVIVVLGILASISTFGYTTIRRSAIEKAAQSDLQHASAVMEKTIQETTAYPSTLPTSITNSTGITLTLAETGAEPYYTNISDVQQGVLFAQICADLISEGVGRGVNQGGTTENYITGCGNWNHDSMQITGWNSRVWNVPINEAPFLNYANTFTTNDTWNKVQETVVKNFYNGLVDRYKKQGGAFPINSFWDSWATPQNGGVMNEPLPSNPVTKPYFCIEARSVSFDDILWHITQDDKITEGGC